MSFKIGIMPGDGTGPEVTAEGVKVLDVVAEKNGFTLEKVNFDFGGERFLRTGEVLPNSAIDDFRKLDAILLGAIGHPDVKPGILEQGLLLRTRFELRQYINLRPVRLYPGVPTPLANKGPEDIDFVIVRENNEGLYCGAGGFMHKNTEDEVATQLLINTRAGVERCIRWAFEYTRKYGKHDPKMLTLVAKTNVLTFAHDLWDRVFHEVGKADYPEIKRDYAHVDATCMWMVKNPEYFDVIVTTNMFGDIITDLGAMLQGGMGIAAGGNINPKGVSMFEPIGGSAPKYTGQGVINPLASICAMGMMLQTLGEDAAANQVEEAVKVVTSTKLKGMGAGRMGYSTSEVGDLVVQAL
ncbi:MAG: 3-isopropylmalate dehydrogenase [Planctomycetota bacterium]|nr:3-isopropylmalate dehydrogenase [Planctomycetota bacterium]MDA1138376.1 3-isopropylmalate dehydrogenase [Planctomycetota bacterium]